MSRESLWEYHRDFAKILLEEDITCFVDLAMRTGMLPSSDGASSADVVESTRLIMERIRKLHEAPVTRVASAVCLVKRRI